MWRNGILIHQEWDYKMVRPLWKAVWFFFVVQAAPLCIRNRWMIKSQVVVQSWSHVWLCNPVDCSMPGFPVPHQLPELAQIRVHRVGDAIQPSCPLSSTDSKSLLIVFCLSILLLYMIFSKCLVLAGLGLCCSEQASHCGGFSCGALPLGRSGFSSRDTWAQ